MLEINRAQGTRRTTSREELRFSFILGETPDSMWIIITPYQSRVNLLILTSQVKYGKLSLTTKVRDGWRETEKLKNRCPAALGPTPD
jgi:hypothetical protein